MKKVLLLLIAFISLIHSPTHTQDVDMDVVVMVEQNDLEAFAHELDCGLDPNAGLGELSLLMIAAQIGHIEIVKELLAREGIDLQAQDENGNTALHFAAIFDRLDVVKALLYADEPIACKCKKNSHPRELYKIQNKEGKVAADFAYSMIMQEMLANPDEYIQSHPQEFREIAKWFHVSCPVKAEARARRLESFGDKVNRNYQDARVTVAGATEKTVSAIKHVYEKTKDVAVKGYEATQKAKVKVESKYDKAKAFVTCRYEKARTIAHDAFGKTKEYANAGVEKTKDAFRTAYRKLRGGNAL